jgi:hypothetical protein
MRAFTPRDLRELSRAQFDELQALIKSGHRFKVFQWGELVVSPLEEESHASHSSFYLVRSNEWLVPQRIAYFFVAVGMALLAGVTQDGNKLAGAIGGVTRNLFGGKDVTDYVLVAIRRNLHVVTQQADAMEFLKNLST